MIVSPDILFIHIPKAAGTSCAKFLCDNLRGPIAFFSVPHAGNDKTYRNAKLYPGFNHETLEEIYGDQDRILNLSGLDVNRVKKILAVIRHPYDMEASVYRFFRNGHRNYLQSFKNSPNVAERIALAQGSFREFVAKSGYFRKESENSLGGRFYRTEDYLFFNGKLPDNLEVLKFEDIGTSLPAAVKPYMARQDPDFPHLNRAQGIQQTELVEPDNETRKLIAEKHSWVFEQGYYSP